MPAIGGDIAGGNGRRIGGVRRGGRSREGKRCWGRIDGRKRVPELIGGFKSCRMGGINAMKAMLSKFPSKINSVLPLRVGL